MDVFSSEGVSERLFKLIRMGLWVYWVMRQSFNILLLCVVKWASEFSYLIIIRLNQLQNMPNLNNFSYNTNRSFTQEQLINLSNQAETQGNPLPEYLRQLIREVKLKREQREKKIDQKETQVLRILQTFQFLGTIFMVFLILMVALSTWSFILASMTLFGYIEKEFRLTFTIYEFVAVLILFSVSKLICCRKLKVSLQLTKKFKEIQLLLQQGLNNRYMIKKRAHGREVRMQQTQR